jgi:hypothetical protein
VGHTDTEVFGFSATTQTPGQRPDGTGDEIPVLAQSDGNDRRKLQYRTAIARRRTNHQRREIIDRTSLAVFPVSGGEAEVAEPGCEGKVICTDNGAVDWACDPHLPCPGPPRRDGLRRRRPGRAD